jgi:hypothetical protein
MKVYMAGIYGGGSEQSASLHSAISAFYTKKYPHVLESYAYLTRKHVEQIQDDKRKIFVDSGAYTMFTKGIAVDLAKYAKFLTWYKDIIEIASNVDVIGSGQEQQTYENQKTIENLAGRESIIPVHHVRDSDSWLQRYLDEGYQYIALGGMVPESTKTLRGWLDHIWHAYLTRGDGTARVKVHGFGLTTVDLMIGYPWYSVDSTRWVLASRFGGLLMDIRKPNGEISDYIIDFSTRSQKRYDMNSWHYSSLKPDEKHVIDGRLAELEAERIRFPELEKEYLATFGHEMGFNPVALGNSYGLRDAGNVAYLGRCADRAVNQFTRAQETLF